MKLYSTDVVERETRMHAQCARHGISGPSFNELHTTLATRVPRGRQRDTQSGVEDTAGAPHVASTSQYSRNAEQSLDIVRRLAQLGEKVKKRPYAPPRRLGVCEQMLLASARPAIL